MIRLIVNADDLGAGAPTDRGILEAWRRGIVTSVSLLANGPSFAEAAAAVRAEGIPVGVHLNLAEYRTLTGPIAGLTSPAGDLPGKPEGRRLLAGERIDPTALRRELAAQIDRVRQAGLEPDHLDTHQHCFLLPPLTAVIIDLCRVHDIRALRLPSPAEGAGDDPDGTLGAEMALYRRLVPAAAERIREAGLSSPDGLLGMPLLDRVDEGALLDLLRGLRPGTWELMAHPGYADRGRSFATAARERELEALLSPRVRELIEQREIRLITFRDLPCAS